MALKHLTAIADKYFGGTLEKSGSFVSLRVSESVTVNGSPNSAGCVFYEVAFRELLRLLIEATGQVEHTQCAQKGEGQCEWRAEWAN
jgi:predicted hydrocarbon binding protein